MLNVVALMGRLVADPELRHTPNGVATCTFRIAVDRSFVRAGEERKADFIDIVVWRQTAEFVCKYFHKGNLIAVDGSIQTRTYEDKTGNKRYAFEVVANNVHFTGEKSGSTGGQGGYGAPAPMQAPAARPAPASRASRPPALRPYFPCPRHLASRGGLVRSPTFQTRDEHVWGVQRLSGRVPASRRNRYSCTV